MSYVNGWPHKLKNKEDVENWFKHLLFVDKIGFHPDAKGEEYVDHNLQPILSTTEIHIFNILMDRARNICDVYKVGFAMINHYKQSIKITTLLFR